MSYSSVVLADAPYSYWRLNDVSTSSGSTEDDSGNSHTTFAYGGSPTPGQTGALAGDSNKAVLFNGTNQRMFQSGPPVGMVGTGPHSWELWFKTSAAAASRRSLIAACYGHADGLAGFNLDITATQIIAEVRTPGTTEAAATVGYADGVFHHVVMTLTRGAPDVLRLYVDGVVVATTNLATAGQSFQPAYGGLWLATNDNQAAYVAGTFDEVALYNTALSAGQVAAHYAAAVPPPAANVLPAAFLGV
jgi:hypothetical protein